MSDQTSGHSCDRLSDATVRALVSVAGPLPERPRVLDLGRGPRRPLPEGAFDLVRAEGAACSTGLEQALTEWRGLLAPDGALVVAVCPGTEAQGVAAARTAGYHVAGMRRQPAGEGAERSGCAGFVLRPADPRWRTRPETPADVPAVHRLNAAAFGQPDEAELVEALRADPDAWLPGLSYVAEGPDGTVAAYALLTRCRVGDAPALALAPVAVAPGAQRRGAGRAVVRAVLDEARIRGERLVLVLGHPAYYPAFGFVPASRYGIRPGFEVPDEAMRALDLAGGGGLPSGVIHYPAAFGV
ncbi:GNAT family N-acetyltransferase [Streptomyces solincola]|uniref:GNAT family N-acetyltransferase n=1 Tax=Streptomyces solincola TaxID=2100817 RepID=UPI002158B032|nr:N-acetyltransferase [Streptomyces solincola]